MDGVSRFLSCFVFLLSITVNLSAAPIDLSTFTGDPGVLIDVPNGEIIFFEDTEYTAWYAYNDAFQVSANDTLLSFDYGLLYGPDDFDDYLVFEVNYIPVFSVSLNPGESLVLDSFVFDLTPYRNYNGNGIISLAWGLIYAGTDFGVGTTAGVWNIDVTTETPNAPVPEPATILLLGTGLLGVAGFRKRLSH